MQIILLHRNFKTKSITLTPRHLLFALASIGLIATLMLALLAYIGLSHSRQISLPFLANITISSDPDNQAGENRYVKQNLNAMATKLGEMQAQLMRLDALGERVQGLAGVKPEEFNFREMPGRGGPETLIAPDGSSAAATSEIGHSADLQAAHKVDMRDFKKRDFDMADFRVALDETARAVERRADYMNVVETTLMSFKVKSKMLPTMQPVNVSYNSSGFGWRLDPFTGHNAFHEGVDFPAPIGTPISAAAGGVVIAAEYHPQYGNMLEIDHGNDIVTRYAHASKLLVKVGDIVKHGQRIAEIGSTGRSTGAHLHFEVLVKGIPQNPHKFLIAGSNPAPTTGISHDHVALLNAGATPR